MSDLESSDEAKQDAKVHLSKKQELVLTVITYVVFLFLLEVVLRLFASTHLAGEARTFRPRSLQALFGFWALETHLHSGKP